MGLCSIRRPSPDLIRRLVVSVASVAGVLAWGSTAGHSDQQPTSKPSTRAGQFTPPFEANLLLISVDTMRADHLGCYGYNRPTSPHIDGLAADGHLFEATYTVMPTTLPSHATMFTSLYPAQHGAQRNGTTVPAEAYMMAERLREHRFETAAFVGAAVLSPSLGLRQGFDTYIAPAFHEWPATRVQRAAAKWLRQHRDKRFFCFVHFYDPHNWYAAPREFAARFQAPPRQLPPERGMVKRAQAFTAELCTQTINAYDAEIHYADNELGVLLDQLARLKLRERTIIVVVSDHGETLDELLQRYGYAFSHGDFLYRRELRIPFVLWLPKAYGLPGRGVHGEPASTLDLLPTLLELLGVPCAPPFEGRSLVPLLAGQELAPRPIISARHEVLEKQVRKHPTLRGAEFAVIDGPWHWIHSSGRDDELLDIRADPQESENLLSKHPETVGRLATILRRWSESLGAPLDRTGEQPVDPEIIRSLRALGYLGGEEQEAEEGEATDEDDDE